jgi:hypothetical protein
MPAIFYLRFFSNFTWLRFRLRTEVTVHPNLLGVKPRLDDTSKLSLFFAEIESKYLWTVIEHA